MNYKFYPNGFEFSGKVGELRALVKAMEKAGYAGMRIADYVRICRR